jgi:hypothetical protein
MYSTYIDRHRGILVTTDSGIYRSKTAPYDEWEFVARGITAPDYKLTHFTNVSQVAQDKSTGIFFAASRGQSVYKSTVDLGSGSSTVVPIVLAKQNYPNPFATRTSIPFTLQDDGRVVITLSNMLGSFERVITNDFFAKGSHEVVVDARELPAGSYLYLIEYPDGSREANMMILTK